MRLAERTYVALDLETTGLIPESDAIIEIGAVRFREGRRIAVFHSLVNPQRPIPYRVLALCRISPHEVEAAPTFGTLGEDLRAFVGSDAIVGHNIGFDLGFLARHGLTFSNPIYDTLDLAKLLLPTLSERNLSAVAAHLGVPTPSAHRALADAEVVREVFTLLLDRLYALDPFVLREVLRISQKADWWVGRLLAAVAEERTGALLPASPAFGIGLSLPRTEDSPESLPQGAEIMPLGVQAVRRMFESGGLLERVFPDYEPRPPQVEMACAVAAAFNSREHLIVEAGTGVGKSLAYLLPAVMFAHRNGVPVVVSTHTIALQDQLLSKDIPALLQALGLEIRIAQIKGRTNYLCLRRWDMQRRAENPAPEAVPVMARIQVWLASTQTGDRAEIHLDGRESAFWQRVSAQSFDCLGRKCAFYQRGMCFLHHARAKAQGAHLIIVNHALLLSEIAAGAQILPEYRYLIIDEAHHLEDVATEQLGEELRESELFDLLDQALDESREHRSGLLVLLERLLRAADRPPGDAAAALTAEAMTAVTKVRGRAQDFFEGVARFIQSHTATEGEYDLALRITSALRAQPAWADIEISCDNVVGALDGVVRCLRKIESAVQDELLPEAVKSDLASLGNNLEEMRRRLDSLVLHGDDRAVHWFTLGRRSNRVTLNSAPLHVGSLLERVLYSRKDAVVLTSATLSTGGGFEYVKGRLGVRANELLLGSPFDYEQAAVVYLAADIPEPGRPGYQEMLVEVLIELCRSAEGKSLVLFTSHAALRAVQAGIAGRLEEEDILVLGQGLDGSPRKLLSRLKENSRTVLLGAASFWEGVDVVGDALILVVIVRLPFSVPTDPIFAARSETFEDPFNEYALPQAALRFKQGFGRLIRSKRDRGAMAVLDSRLVNKTYASVFLGSLPPCRVERLPCRSLAGAVKRWLEKPR